MPIKWVPTILLGLLWFFIACTNAYFHSAFAIRQYRREPSSYPFVGGFFAVLASTACPWQSPLKWIVLVAALILDLGSLRLLTLLVIGIAFPHRLKAIDEGRKERVERILRGG